MSSRVVIKLGGSALQDPQTLEQLAGLIRQLCARGQQVAVVHGGGPSINQELERAGITWRFIDGQRQTTPQMMEVIDRVLYHQINMNLVDMLHQQEIPAKGLSGAAHGILICTKASDDLQQVGKIDAVNTRLLERMLIGNHAAVPVIAPLGVGADGQRFNVNADWAAARIASALHAQTLIYLTDQEGILDAAKNVMAKIDPSEIEAMILDGTIHGGMSVKVKAMMAALHEGAGEVRVLSAKRAASLLADANIGTTLIPTQYRSFKSISDNQTLV